MEFINIPEVEYMLQCMHELETAGETNKLPSFYRPMHFIGLALTLQKRRPKNFTIQQNHEFLRYTTRMQLWESLGLPSPLKVSQLNPRGRFHPLTPLQSPQAVDKISSELAHLFSSEGAENKSSIEIAVAELVGNSFAHSSSQNGDYGFVCAQKWPRANKAQIAIGDSGIGIRASLDTSSEFSNILLKRNACELATEYEVTSKRGKNHSGFGLTLARSLIQNNNGTFLLVSYDEYLIDKGAYADIGILQTPFPGTLVVMEWHTNIPLSATEVYNSWPSPEENDYDFNF